MGAPDPRRRTATGGIRVRLTLRGFAATLLAAGALTPTLAFADPPIATTQVRVGAVSVPSVTMPSVSTPPVAAPSVSTPVASTPPVHVPAVSTPAVSTPPVKTPVPAPAPAAPDTPVTSRVPTTKRAPVAPPAPVARAPTAGNPAPLRPPITRRAQSPRRTGSEGHAGRSGAVRWTRRGATKPVALRRPSPARPGGASDDLRYDAGPRPAMPAGDPAGPTHQRAGPHRRGRAHRAP
jgi:hypothetical protein